MSKFPSIPNKSPDPLSDQYHKARRQLMLWSAILFAWELVGIDLDKLANAGGNIGGAVSALQSPQAVPWVLLILVGYFLFRCIVEWKQCDKTRRASLVSRSDFGVAVGVAIGAFGLYFGQRLLETRIADAIEEAPYMLDMVFLSVMVCVLTPLLYIGWHKPKPIVPPKATLVLLLLSALALVSIIILDHRFSTYIVLPTGLVIAATLASSHPKSRVFRAVFY